MMRARLLGGVLLALGVAGCGDEIPPPNPASFDRPGRVAFVCFQTDNRDSPKPQRLHVCDPRWQPFQIPNVALHALVTQTTRGEIAAVDLQARRVLDSRQDIPGPTFLPAGELPSAVVVAAHHPDATYVANAGSRDIRVLRTRAFRELTPGEDPTLQIVRVRAPNAGAEAGSPLDLIMSPDEDALFVAVPDRSLLLRMPIMRCAASTGSDGSSDDEDAGATSDSGATCIDGLIDEDAIEAIPLDLSFPQAAVPPASTATEAPYRFVCDATPTLPVQEPAPVALPATSEAARPVSLAVDAFCPAGQSCPRRLLVADRALPIIHVIDLDATGAAAVLPPIVTGTPTEAVAVSPRVPARVDASGTDETQYVYAIDHHDGSVMVIEDGRVLSVSSDPAGRPDRLALGPAQAPGDPVALSLELLTPGFDVTAPANQFGVLDSLGRVACPGDDEPTDAARLRGVFLAVGVSDGSIRIVDVHDMNLACRTCEVVRTPVVRHRTRISSSLEATNGVLPSLAPGALPTFVIDRGGILVQADGTTNDPRVPGLECLSCAAPKGIAFPDQSVADDADAGASEPMDMPGACAPGAPLVCALADPWVASELWIARYEGRIPGTTDGHGRFLDAQAGLVRFEGEATFCSKGVLGDADAPGGRGDQVVITASLPPADLFEDAALLEDCQRLVQARDAGEGNIAFRIESAFDDHLMLDPRLLGAPSNLPSRRRNVGFVQQCFANMLMTFDVRARDTFVVDGRQSGFLHRVTSDASGRCVDDALLPATRTGRAWDGETFDNGLISFRIRSRSSDSQRIRPAASTELQLGVTTTTSKVLYDATRLGFNTVPGVLPVDLQYNAQLGVLYVVDMSERGLIPIPTDPFPFQSNFSFQ